MFIDVKTVAGRISNNQKVIIDVGGCGDAGKTLFPNTSHVMDIFPPNEQFKQQHTHINFILGDAADYHVWQKYFSLKCVDFAICSHTIEDTLDPTPIIRNISAFAKAGYFEFPSVAQEVLPDNSPFGMAHHSWFVRVMPLKEALSHRWLLPIKTADSDVIFNNGHNEKVDLPFIIAYLPKVFAYGNEIRCAKYKVPFKRKLFRKRFWQRSNKFHNPKHSWTGIFWTHQVQGAVIGFNNLNHYRHILQEWCMKTKDDPEYFAY